MSEPVQRRDVIIVAARQNIVEGVVRRVARVFPKVIQFIVCLTHGRAGIERSSAASDAKGQQIGVFLNHESGYCGVEMLVPPTPPKLPLKK